MSPRTYYHRPGPYGHVWMVIEDGDGHRSGYEIEAAKVQIDHQVFFDEYYAGYLIQARPTNSITVFSITTYTGFRVYTPTDRPPARHDTHAIGPIRQAVEPPPPRENNDSAGTSRSTD